MFATDRLPDPDQFRLGWDLRPVDQHASLVERVDVLTGGASAVYGADAVAGVVNFIMKKDFEGVRVDAQWQTYQHSQHSDHRNADRHDYCHAGCAAPHDHHSARKYCS